MLRKTIAQRRNKERKGLSPTVVIIDKGVQFDKPKPKLIKTWDELKECTSETHVLEIEVKNCNGWIRPKVPDKKDNWKGNHYLSTHTFYGGTHKYSTELLQSCGFNVEIANWDELGW